ncbi:hypothetical protein SAMN05444921_11550 [Streptomyces wuyuanensis]|uniref:Uncharacterized protein n=1 Tax=Streptomyces wuyuanensis TaxID=1196353 RepID=A0A1G9X3K8_9ACTN|nr:hypothetical protein SAMN05444921_11550 [Streptomyces wuyuanensis]
MALVAPEQLARATEAVWPPDLAELLAALPKST